MNDNGNLLDYSEVDNCSVDPPLNVIKINLETISNIIELPEVPRIKVTLLSTSIVAVKNTVASPLKDRLFFSD